MAEQPTGDTKTSSQSTRGNWGTHLGFILAAAGSAIGLGNIWKFPYITGDYGGGAFVLVYLLSVVVVGLPAMLAELIIGRRSQKSPVGAFQAMHRKGSPWRLTGWLGILSGFVILAIYSVIAGWSMAYVYKSLQGFSGSAADIMEQFDALAGSAFDTSVWHTLFMVLCTLIVIGGVQRGIERWNKILMPLLVIILVGLATYGIIATHGGGQAIAFLFKPDFSKLSAEGVLSALGHAFFTLSLGMGAMITYGSYMKRGSSLVKDAITISILDTLIALIAGVAIFSLVFHYNMEPSQSVGLIFKTLPVLFAETGPWISVPFFILLSFAALTSGISLLEVVVSYFIDERGWSRMKATLIMASAIYLVGLFAANPHAMVPFTNLTVFGLIDVTSTNYMLPIGGLLTVIFLGWVVSDAVRKEELNLSDSFAGAFKFIVKYLTPIAILIVLLHGVQLLPFVDF
ncbi:MAG TPA: sodium-dependent transporter [candidate division Zixibacteria bacterium]|nr:sodium-dependent transporter [candidate division Zixibacteria bacterium]